MFVYLSILGTSVFENCSFKNTCTSMSLTTTDIDLETVASLFEVQLSERSGLLRSREFKIEGKRRRQRQPEAIDFTRSAEFAYSRRCDAASRT